VGEGEAGEAAGDRCQSCGGGWTATVSVYKSSPQSIVAVQRVGMTVGSHPSPTALEADIKTFPPPQLPKEPAVI